jgi:hypothetical protein
LLDIGRDGLRLPMLTGPMQGLLPFVASELGTIADALANVRSSAADMIARVLAQ